MRPPVSYAASGAVRVAYQVTGSGPIDLVWAPGTISHLDLDWEHPAKARFIEALSSFARLIRFDKRGTGLSDRPTDAATLEERTDDIRAVMDAAGSSRAAILGMSEGASMACLFAATPPRTHPLFLVWGGQARWGRTDDYPWWPDAEARRPWSTRPSRTGLPSTTSSARRGLPGCGPGTADWRVVTVLWRGPARPPSLRWSG